MRQDTIRAEDILDINSVIAACDKMHCFCLRHSHFASSCVFIYKYHDRHFIFGARYFVDSAERGSVDSGITCLHMKAKWKPFLWNKYWNVL